MGMFQSPGQQPVIQENIPQNQGRRTGLALLWILGALFLPATILGFAYNKIFFVKKRQRPRIIYLGFLILGILLYVYNLIFKPMSYIGEAIADMPDSLMLLIHPYIYICIWISMFIGFIILPRVFCRFPHKFHFR